MSQSFNTLFENKQYKDALDLYNSSFSLKANLYKVITVKDFCIDNNYNYLVVEKEKPREILIPYYYGSKEPEKIKKVISPEIYVAELENANIIGGNSAIIVNDYCLYDMAKRDNQARYDLRCESIKNIDKNYAVIGSMNSNEVFKEAISLVGVAPYNYYHFTVELLSRLQYVDQFEEYRYMPLLIDEMGFNIPQHRELLHIINKFNHPIIPIKKNYRYKIKKLIYPSYNTWMPINKKAWIKSKPEDYLIADSAVEYIRNNVLNNIKSKGHKKIFISRKNCKNVRLINHEEVVELFKKYGFEIIYPENAKFQQQVKLFSEAEYIAGVTGSGFTNILYCSSNAKVLCIIPKEHGSCLYSTISKILGLKCIFLDAKVITKRKRAFADRSKLDINYCRDCLNNLL
ncbi:glycosyltransferase family 61 protein [Crassaminicella indica]|uniref:Glycosyltransferase family 61 protein n=1 Tax=Crassaminicella indica TaxID=2855394 RepID=A0ABX8RAA6_9CLOT|nr:glycosyltransferase family 61 protein [Crassaminicella indica]QXM05958.1 glycosyltransferase family 61 protein [Crassaminicella indica]